MSLLGIYDSNFFLDYFCFLQSELRSGAFKEVRFAAKIVSFLDFASF